MPIKHRRCNVNIILKLKEKMQKNKINSPFALIKSAYLLAMSLLFFSNIAPVIAGEYVYISDNLRVGVRVEPASGTPPIGVVFTGMRLEVHDKVDGYVNITTNKGLKGWIKDIYVTKKAPAIIQLNTLRVKYEKSQKELSAGQDAVAILEKANLSLINEMEDMKEERREWSTERAKLMASQYKESSWFWVIQLILLVGLSFAGGIFWYKSYVMKRLGGLRV